MPTVRSNGVSLYYEETGSGQPVLLVHGGGGNLLQWSFQVPCFSQRCRTVAVDLRGHGRSETPADGYSLEIFSADLLGLMDALGMEKATLVGLTLGGMVGLRFALDHPDRLHALVLVSVSEGGRQTMRERFEMSAQIAETQGMEMLAEGFCSVLFSPWFLEEKHDFVEAFKKSMQQSSPRGYAQTIRALANRPPLSGQLGRMRTPTLVVVGEDDVTEFPLQDAPLYTREISRAELMRIPRAGHLACIEQPDLFNEGVMRFLRERGP